jgi:hypothetical protein
MQGVVATRQVDEKSDHIASSRGRVFGASPEEPSSILPLDGLLETFQLSNNMKGLGMVIFCSLVWILFQPHDNVAMVNVELGTLSNSSRRNEERLREEAMTFDSRVTRGAGRC